MYVMMNDITLRGLGQTMPTPGGVLPLNQVEAYRKELIRYWGSQGPFPMGTVDSRVLQLQKGLNRIAPGMGFRQLPETGKLNNTTCFYINRMLGPSVYSRLGCFTDISEAERNRSLQNYQITREEQLRLLPVTQPRPTPMPPMPPMPITQVPSNSSIRMSPDGRSYCTPRDIMCFHTSEYKQQVIDSCNKGVRPQRGTKSCFRQKKFASNNLNQYDPCQIKDFPVCPSQLQSQPQMPAIRQVPLIPVPSMPAIRQVPLIPAPSMPAGRQVPYDPILQYKDIQFREGPNQRVSRLIVEHLNPALVASGNPPMDTNRRFGKKPCAVIQAFWPQYISSQFSNCPKVENPQRFFRLPNTNGLGELAYCEPRSNMCFDTSAEKNAAVADCQKDVLPDRGTDSCKRQQRLMFGSNMHQYDPCDISNYPICPESLAEFRARLAAEKAASAETATPITTAPISVETTTPVVTRVPVAVPVAVPVPVSTNSQNDGYDDVYDDVYDDDLDDLEDDVIVDIQAIPDTPPEEEKDKTVMVLGILGALAIGGGAVYLMTRKKKRR